MGVTTGAWCAVCACVMMGAARVVSTPAPVNEGSDFATGAVSRAAQRTFHWQTQSTGARRGRPTVYLHGLDAEAQVDVATGILVNYQSLDKAAYDSGLDHPQVGPEGALAVASAFVERAGIPLRAWSLRWEHCLSHGANVWAYDVQWGRLIEGVRLPAIADVDVDAQTGVVLAYFIIDDPVTTSLKPRISAQQAAEVVAARMGYQQPVVESVELAVWYRPAYPGRQALLWCFTRMSDAATPGVHLMGANVDAVTGELVQIMLPMGTELPPVPGRERKNKRPQVKPAPAKIKAPTLDLAALKNAKAPPTVFQVAGPRKR